MERLTSLLLLACAQQDQGIYPAAVVENGQTRERTPWQDGWNAACMDLTQKHLNLIQWFKGLPAEQANFIETLLAQDAIYLTLDDDHEVSVGLLMNDTFGFAVADSEEVPMEHLGVIWALWEDFEQDGLVGYAAAKRKDIPIMPWQTPRFFKAHARAQELLAP